jgi:hypothetical protein
MQTKTIQDARIAISGYGQTPSLQDLATADLRRIIRQPLYSRRLRDFARGELLSR